MGYPSLAAKHQENINYNCYGYAEIFVPFSALDTKKVKVFHAENLCIQNIISYQKMHPSNDFDCNVEHTMLNTQRCTHYIPNLDRSKGQYQV